MLSHSTSFGSAHRSQKKLQNGFFIPKPPVRVMAGHSFEESFELLKNLVSEIADPTMGSTGRKLRVKPSAAEKFHNMHRGRRDRRANEIAEENMTPNMVIDEKMSRSFAPQHMYQDTRYRDKTVPPEMQIGHMVSDAQKRRLPQAHEMPAPASFAEAQQRGSGFQGPLPYEQVRQFPDDPTNPFKLKSSPFDRAWRILKAEKNFDPEDPFDDEANHMPAPSIDNPFQPLPTHEPLGPSREFGRGGTEGMSRGPMRSRKRGNPASNPRFVRPGFRGPAMPLTDNSAQRRME